jgi:hypothetical protein
MKELNTLQIETENTLVDEWSGLASLLANLIEKYASELDIDTLPDPPAMGAEEACDEKIPSICGEEIEMGKVA